MKTTIDVANRKEGALIRAGLACDDVRAFVKIVGAMEGLPTDRSRKRVLGFVYDKLQEERESQARGEG